MTEEIISTCEQSLNHTLEPPTRQLLKAYFELMLEWNKKMNLFSRKSEREVLINGLLESFGLYKNIAISTGRMIDIGSGNGLPGMIIAILKPECEVYLLDLHKKRCEFLDLVKTELNLTNLTVINSRLEILEKKNKKLGKSFDLLFSRGVGNFDQYLFYYYHLLKSTGSIIMLTGTGGLQTIMQELEAKIEKRFQNGRVLDNPHLAERVLIFLDKKEKNI